MYEILADCILLPTVQALAKPTFINGMILSLKPPSNDKQDSADVDDYVDPTMNQLNLASVLQDNAALAELSAYLDIQNKGNLLKFWMNADSFKSFGQVVSHEYLANDAMQIVNLHFGSDAKEPVTIPNYMLEKLIKNIDINPTPNVFADVQAEVFEMLEHDVWPGFIKTEAYKRLGIQPLVRSESNSNQEIISQITILRG